MKKFTIILLALVLAVPAFAQGKFGKDSAECVKYLSYYSELVKQGNLNDAAPHWRQAMSLCPPTANQNMILNGQKIVRYEINKNKQNPERVKQLVDTLLMLSDIRAQYYPKYAVKSLDNKALDITTYCASDCAFRYAELGKILDQIKSEASPAVYVNQMQASVEMYKNNNIEADAVMDDYTKLIGLLDDKIAASNNNDYRAAKQTVESIFIESGVASCDNLVALYTPRFEANPTDGALLGGMVKMLSKSECTNTELFLKSVEALNELDPSASSAYYLYRLYSSRDENTKAATALEKSISLLPADDKATKAEYTFELATYYYKKCGKNGAAVAKAKEAVEIDPSYQGKAYLLIGTIWGTQRCGGNEVEARAHFWVAVDYLRKAAAADPEVAADANKLAGQYSAYFPKQVDAFMYDIMDGSGYTVSCGGMTEHTTVRTIK